MEFLFLKLFSTSLAFIFADFEMIAATRIRSHVSPLIQLMVAMNNVVFTFFCLPTTTKRRENCFHARSHENLIISAESTWAAGGREAWKFTFIATYSVLPWQIQKASPQFSSARMCRNLKKPFRRLSYRFLFHLHSLRLKRKEKLLPYTPHPLGFCHEQHTREDSSKHVLTKSYFGSAFTPFFVWLG